MGVDLRGYETTNGQFDLLERVARNDKWLVNRQVADAVDKVLSDVTGLRERVDEEFELRLTAESERDLARGDRDRALDGQKRTLGRACVAEQKVEVLGVMLSAALAALSAKHEEAETLKDELHVANITTQYDLDCNDQLRDVARGWQDRALRAEQDLAAMTRHAGEVEERNLLNARKAVEYQARFEKYKALYQKADQKLTTIWGEAGSSVR
jgi:hypothetical protein